MRLRRTTKERRPEGVGRKQWALYNEALSKLRREVAVFSSVPVSGVDGPLFSTSCPHGREGIADYEGQFFCHDMPLMMPGGGVDVVHSVLPVSFLYPRRHNLHSANHQEGAK